MTKEQELEEMKIIIFESLRGTSLSGSGMMYAANEIAETLQKDDIVEDLTSAANEIESLNKQKKILNDDIRLLQKKYYLLMMDYKKFFEANRPDVKFDAPEMNNYFTEEAKKAIEEEDNDKD